MKISKTALAAPLAVALAIPAFAVGQSGPSEEAKPAGTAYGVMCQRAPLSASKSNENDPQPGTPFSRCVSQHRQGTNGNKTAAAAAREACRQNPALKGEAFGQCVASTRNLILGLRGLKAQS